MAKYDSVDDAAEKHLTYPALDQDFKDHDFQRRRVQSCVRFMRHGDKVLDIACNTGAQVEYWPKNIEVHGVDINPKLVEVAATRMKSARVARAEDLPFPDKSFDVVNISGILEQVFSPELVVKEAARVSRRFLTGNTTHESGTWGTHRIERHQWQAHSYSKERITELLNGVGTITELGTIDLLSSPPEPQCWFWCVRVL